MTEQLTEKLHDTASRVPTRLRPGRELRLRAERHRRNRRVGATAGSLALVLVVAVLGLAGAGGQRDAARLPAEQPPLSRDSLLIEDELPGNEIDWRPEAREGESALPPELCQQGSLRSLGATSVWHQSASDQDLGLVAQTAAQFPAAAEAEAALDRLTRWFGECGGYTPADGRLPDFRAGTGTVRTGTYTREAPDGPDFAYFGVAAFGVQGHAITVVWRENLGQDDNFAANPLATTMRFALARLAGARTVAANQVPAGFRFAEERADPKWDRSPATSRSRVLHEPWASNPCQYDHGDAGLQPPASDALRTGSRIAQRAERSVPVRQLALYPDARTAREVAAELRSAFERCASVSDGIGTTTWVTQRSEGAADLTVSWSSYAEEGGGPPTYAPAVAVATQGNAVLLVSQVLSVEPGPDSDAVRAVRAAVEANLPLVCEVATGC
ncbi:MAG TPA: hypothetical protein VFV76_11860 [Actinomycetes bacterium]|nr:hypothetical protein [Actinomycetes bacterium]